MPRGQSGKTSRRPAPPSTVAVPPTPTITAAGPAESTATRSSPRPRLEARSGSSSSGRRSGSPSAAAESTTAGPSARTGQRATIGRPSGSETIASCASPPITSAVPSPPSATGSATASAPPRSSPSASSAAASTAETTPLRLAGHASARTLVLLGGGLHLGRILRHLAQHRDRQALACEEDEPDPDADRRLDRLQPDREREALAIGNAVRAQRQRDRRLEEADVAGPEREDRRDVHQHEDDSRNGDRLVDVEREHRRPDGEQLEEPAERLERPRRDGGDPPAHDREGHAGLPGQGGGGGGGRGGGAPEGPAERWDRPRRDGGYRPAHDREADACLQEQVADRAELSADGALVAARGEPGEGEDGAAEPEHDDEARDRPVRQAGCDHHPDDERRDREEVEHAVSDDGAEQPPPRRLAVGHAPGEHRDAGDLSDTPGDDDVPEQADAEGGEDENEAGARLWQRLLDRRVPARRTRDHRQEVEADRCDDPLPLDTGERVTDGVPVRTAPPDHEAGDAEQNDGDEEPPAASWDLRPHYWTARS